MIRVLEKAGLTEELRGVRVAFHARSLYLEDRYVDEERLNLP
jgi:hypothetical protein